MRVRPFLASFVLGASALISSQNLRAQDFFQQQNPQAVTNEYRKEIDEFISTLDMEQIERSKLEKPKEYADSLEYLQFWQNIRLQLLLSPERSPEEIVQGLQELKVFVNENRSSYTQTKELNDKRQAVFKTLLESGYPELQLLFKKILENISSGTPEVKTDDLNCLREITTMHQYASSSISLEKVLDASNASAPFFNETLQKPQEDIRTIEAFIQSSFELFKLININDNSCRNKFVNWLDLQTKAVLEENGNDIEVTKRKEKLLEETIRTTINNNFIINVYGNTAPTKRTEIANTILPSYTKLIEKNISNPSYIVNGLEALQYIQRLAFDPSPSNGINENLQNSLLEKVNYLYKVIIENINNQKSSESLHTKVIGNLIWLQDSDINRANILLKLFSENYFTEKNSTKRMLNFFSEFAQEQNGQISSRSRSAYLLHIIVNNNRDYFSRTMGSVLNLDAKTEDEKVAKINKLKDIYVFFNVLPDIVLSNVIPPSRPPADDPKEILKEELRVWGNENILKPVINTFLTSLKNEDVTVEYSPLQGRRYVHNRSWENLNEDFEAIISRNPSLSTEWLNTINNKLENTTDSYDRAMCYESLEPLFYTGSQEEVTKALEILRSGLITEISPIVSESIGNTIAKVISFERKAEIISYSNTTQNFNGGFPPTNPPAKKPPYPFMLYHTFYMRLDDINSKLTPAEVLMLESLSKQKAENLTPEEKLILKDLTKRKAENPTSLETSVLEDLAKLRTEKLTPIEILMLEDLTKRSAGLTPQEKSRLKDLTKRSAELTPQEKSILEDLTKRSAKNPTPGQIFIIDLLRIRRSDYDLFQELMPDKDLQGRMLKEDYLAIRQLEHNAFISLANSAISYDDDREYKATLTDYARTPANDQLGRLTTPKLSDIYKEIVFEALFKELNLYLMYSDEHTWGEDVIQLVKLNLNRGIAETKSPTDALAPRNYHVITKEEKLKVPENLHKILFEKYGSLIELYKDRLVVNYCQENNVSYPKLTPEKLQQIREGQGIRDQIQEIKTEFVHDFLDLAPSSSMTSYMEHLNKLGSFGVDVETEWRRYLEELSKNQSEVVENK